MSDTVDMSDVSEEAPVRWGQILQCDTCGALYTDRKHDTWHANND